MSWLQDVQSLQPGDVVNLFDIDLTMLGGTVQRFAPGPKDSVGTAVTWRGQSYQALPIKAEGFSKNGKGPFPRPRLTIFINDMIRAMIKTYGGLKGAKVTRWQVFKHYLDGEINADPDQHMPIEVYYIANRTAQGLNTCEWSLRSPIDIEGTMIPGRICTRICGFPYRRWNGSTFDYSGVYGCSYTGTSYFNALGEATSAANDVCGKRAGDCKKRFPTGPMPFGGFPGVGRARIQ